MTERIPVLKEPAPKPKRKAGKRLLGAIYLLFIVLLAVLFFRSELSKISDVTVSGGRFTDEGEILGAAGVGPGDPFFWPTAEAIAERVKRLDAVADAAVRKTFPGRVHIEVTEYPAVAYGLTEDGAITAILSNGAERPIGADSVVDRPVLRDWNGREADKLRLVDALSRLPDDLLSDFSEILPYPSEAWPDRIRIYTRTRFEVVTAVSLLAEKADTIRAVIETQEPGIITLLLADRYMPYAKDEGSGEAARDG
ncbi:MAG: cell division protein DivIB [Thermobacillus sp. ZCTH02-B1]|uniref:cell division protein FtsQ/DivIB n=1 Tax=Thermobacillus sp. ZCTH02-B1 TaxID=1858795 RepID=UPI000B55E767|nr:FtsQ-type POTRA domain-containing protein [Thermobacillus sp. ZCTH02-B1]OUM96223.1 MAG: cell division protein DivIB [Thermobacillus sp. ZCTH02-B1]